MTPAHILLVAPTPETADTAVRCLLCEAQKVKVVRDFESAKAELDREPAALVVTELKLGPYNGLHLALRASATNTPVIVLGTDDPVLELVAQENGVEYLRAPLQLGSLQSRAHTLMAANLERPIEPEASAEPELQAPNWWPAVSPVAANDGPEPAVSRRSSVI